MSVKLVRPAMEYMGELSRLQALDVPPRSRLYGLMPCEVGTVWSESLTSYLNRLGWRHAVSPRALAAEMIVPHLDSDYQRHQLGGFGVITFFRTIFPAKAPGRSRTRLIEASSSVTEQQSRRYSRPGSLRKCSGRASLQSNEAVEQSARQA